MATVDQPQPDARDCQAGGREPPNQVVRLRGRLTFDDDDPILVNDTDSRLLKRDIQAGVILHQTLPILWPRPDPIVVPIRHSGGRADDRNHPICIIGAQGIVGVGVIIRTST